jgi:cytochrome P450
MSASRRDPPGPRTGFLGLAHLRRMREDLLGFPTELARTYGDVACLRMGPQRFYFVNHPAFVREVLVTQGKSFRKLPRIIRAFRSVDGNGLVLSEGDFWLRQRRLVQPAFSPKRFDHYAQTAVNCTREMVDGWRAGTEVEISAAMRRLALRIIARTMFEAEIVDAEGRIGAAIETLSEILTRQPSRVIQWPQWLPTRENRTKHRATQVLDSIIRGVIRERRASKVDKGDLLSMLLAAVDEEGDGTGMTDEQARDEAITLFNAGQDTTAAGLTWLWYLVATHPEVAEKLAEEAERVLVLRNEAQEVLASRNEAQRVHGSRNEAQQGHGERSATYADLPSLAYTTLVVKESLRLYPPTWALIPREAVEDVHLGDFTIRKGGWVYIYPWVLHRDPRFFPEPERFDPERFAPGRVESIPQHAYIPFGAGPHVCIGNSFATMEMVLAVSTVVSRVRLTLPPNSQPIVVEPHVAIRPRGGLTLRVEPARRAAGLIPADVLRG